MLIIISALALIGISTGILFTRSKNQLSETKPNDVVQNTPKEEGGESLIKVKTLTEQDILNNLNDLNSSESPNPTPSIPPVSTSQPTPTPKTVYKTIYITPTPTPTPVPTAVQTKTICKDDIPGENAIIDQYNQANSKAYTDYTDALNKIGPMYCRGNQVAVTLCQVSHNKEVDAVNKKYQADIAQLKIDKESQISALKPICEEVPIN